jgi:hypothetical protein
MPPPETNDSLTRRLRLRIVVALPITVAVGLGSKFYPGPGADWANNSLGGVFYEVFWQLFVLFCLPKASIRRIAVGVFIATCGLEFLQLWHPPFLEALRANFVARTVLGSTFAWSDFPYYVIGSLLGWRLLTRLTPDDES